jgi:MFS family permease
VNPLGPLADRNFRLFFVGETLSAVGNGMALIAINWHVLERTGSATDVSILFALTLGAGLVVLPVGGALVDRFSRRAVAVAGDVVRMAAMGWLAALALAGDPPLWAVYALAFVAGLGHAAFWPAIIALLQEIIDREQLTSASGLTEVTFQAGNLAGAALAGPVIVNAGLGAALAIDVATYAVSAAALLAIRYRPAARPAHASYPAMVREGLAYLAAHGRLAAFGVVSILPFVATMSLNVVAVVYVLEVLDGDATTYGVFDMTYGAGALASGFLAALLVVRFGDRATLVGLLATLTATYAAFAAEPGSLPPAFALMFAAGFCSSAFRVVANAVLLRLVPNAVMGRTTATFSLSATVIQVALALAVGPVIDAAGAGAAFACLAALVGLGLAVLAVTLPALREPMRSGETPAW